jgi:hypothetical protein
MLDYDWHDVFTPEQAVKELYCFKFRGSGWYMGDDVMLVKEHPYRIGSYDFYCWYSPKRDPRDELEEIMNLPPFMPGAV